jgi:hypothetical protein
MALGLAEIVKRLGYHPATPTTVPFFEENRHQAIELALHWDEALPDSREKSLALTALQEALMWANAAVACNSSRGTDPLLPHDMAPEDLPPGALPG